MCPSHLISIPLPFSLVPLQPSILPNKPAPQPHRQHDIKKHEPSTNRHPAHILRPIPQGEHARPQQRPALPHHVQQRNRHAPLGVRPLVIQHPRQRVGNRGENPPRGEEHPRIPKPGIRRRREEEVPRPGYRGEDSNDDPALLGAVAEVGGGDADEECEEVGRRGQALRGDGGVAHLGEDCREEHGERGEGDVAGEVHEGLDPGLRSRQGREGFAEAEGAEAGGAGLSGLEDGAGVRDGPLGRGEEGGGGGGGGEEEEG